MNAHYQGFLSRTGRHLSGVAKAAHPQMRQVMIPMLAAFAERVPLVFDDLEEHFRPAIQEMPTGGRPITTHQPATEEKQ